MNDLKKVPDAIEPVKEKIKGLEHVKGLTKQEVKTDDYTAEIIRDYYNHVDPFYLSKKNPDYAYRFLREEPKNLSLKTTNLLFQKGGWQICPKKHLISLGLKEKEDLSPDGHLRRGDTILAFMPMKLFKEKEAYKRDKAKAPMKAINKILSDGDASVGGVHPTMKGIQTKKALGM